NDSPTRSADPAKIEEVQGKIRAIIDQIKTLNKDNADEIDKLVGEVSGLKLTVTASKVAGLSTEVNQEAAQAKARSSAAVVAKRPETTSLEMVANHKEIIENAANLVSTGFQEEISAQDKARITAEAIVDARLGVFTKDGEPDLRGTRQVSRDLTAGIYAEAAKKLLASGYTENLVDADELLKAFKEKVEYQLTAVLPEFVRSLDNSPEQFAELWPDLVEKVTDEMPRSEIIFKRYKINPLSKAERAAKARADRAAALEANRAKELTDGSDSGEGDGGSTTTDSSDAGKGPTEKLIGGIERQTKALEKVKVDELKDTEVLELQRKLSELNKRVIEIAQKIDARLKPANEMQEI
ncbi:hypothetical protein, partial [Streptomyces sp. 039-1]|uniref:hypothetical protein n=1 Tax=Streptomyces sp. 039-1 TaxID=2789263 RepID=UPI0039F5EB0B